MSETRVARVLVGAAHKSSGKTTFTAGLCAELAARGCDVRPFKKGPDYIDPQWLAAAAQNRCYNLDFNTQTPGGIVESFAARCTSPSASTPAPLSTQASTSSSRIAVIEANKGLYDGVSPDGADSSAALAKTLTAPVVLVMDCEGITRGVAPLLRGYLDFDPDVRIAGVVLNKVGGARHADKLRAAVERYTNLPVVGCIMRDERMVLPERHLGLIPGGEHGQAGERIEAMRRAVRDYVDVEAIVGIAQTAEALEFSGGEPAPLSAGGGKAKLGVFFDSAFSFYYPDDLEALERAGFELTFVNSLRDAALPEVDALFIGGGFPETHAAELEANAPLRAAVRDAVEGGLPAYAECGGLMYLARGIEWRGRRRQMAGVIEADAIVRETPCGRGYARVEETAEMPWPGADGKPRVHAAHEFHYAELAGLPAQAKTAYRMLRGEGVGGGRDGIVYKNLLASFVHLRAVNTDWPSRFRRYLKASRGV